MPARDVGGLWGYDEFQAATADPAHPEHEQYREWARGPFDPSAFDLDAVNEELAELAWRPLTVAAGSPGSARGDR